MHSLICLCIDLPDSLTAYEDVYLADSMADFVKTPSNTGNSHCRSSTGSSFDFLFVLPVATTITTTGSAQIQFFACLGRLRWLNDYRLLIK